MGWRRPSGCVADGKSNFPGNAAASCRPAPLPTRRRYKRAVAVAPRRPLVVKGIFGALLIFDGHMRRFPGQKSIRCRRVRGGCRRRTLRPDRRRPGHRFAADDHQAQARRRSKATMPATTAGMARRQPRGPRPPAATGAWRAGVCGRRRVTPRHAPIRFLDPVKHGLVLQKCHPQHVLRAGLYQIRSRRAGRSTPGNGGPGRCVVDPASERG